MKRSGSCSISSARSPWRLATSAAKSSQNQSCLQLLLVPHPSLLLLLLLLLLFVLPVCRSRPASCLEFAILFALRLLWHFYFVPLHLLATPRHAYFSQFCACHLPLATLSFAFTLGKDFCQSKKAKGGCAGGREAKPTKAKSFICTVFFFLNFCCAAFLLPSPSPFSPCCLCCPCFGVKCLLAICTNMFTYIAT